MMKTPFDFIEEKHFCKNINIEEAKILFRKSIKMVEIETFSYCNRKCWFCPNSFIDRVSKNYYLEESTYLNLLQELATINYSEMISFSRYNEPLADKIILERIKQCREKLPNALIHTNTNGDYLDLDYLENLYIVGLNSINIQVYLNNKQKFDDKLVIAKMKEMLKKLNLPYKMTIEDYSNWYQAELEYKDMKIKMYARNFDKNGCSRGSSLEINNKYERTSPCLSPFYHIYIDYNCNVVPCCNIRSDNPKHKKFILGNLQEESIFDIYVNNTFVKWRKMLFNYKKKKYPCDTCSFITFDDENTNFNKLPINANQWKRKIISLFKSS